jgi:Protein kinase domain
MGIAVAAMGWEISLLADPKFYERTSLLKDEDDRWDIPVQVSGEHIGQENIWTYVTFGDDLPDQGWKIHVSAVAARAQATISVVADVCAAHRTDFKFLRGRRMLDAMNSKYAHRVSSGKFMTIYPRSTAESLKLLDRLAAELRGFPGPYVLNDLSWSDDSPVFTRYGGYREVMMPDTETPTMAIRDASGVLVPDVRDVSFSIPEFVTAPERVLARQQAVAEQAHVDPSFEVTGVLHISNGGGVYRGVRKSGGDCVIKEARPFTAVYGSDSDAVGRLHHEYQMLRRCEAIPEVVRAYGIERLWNHWYLIEEYVDGVTLEEAIADRRGRLTPRSYAAWAQDILAKVSSALELIHGHGVVLGDVHSKNILLTEDDDVRIIDLEAAFPIERRRTFIVGAPGFASAEKTGADVDLHALAALRLRFFNDLPALAALDSHAVVRASALAADVYGVGGPEFEAAVETLGGAVTERGAVADHLVRAFIRAHATVDRLDRLFPGSARSIDGFRDTNFFDGAAGVLWAWKCSGQSVPREWVHWLAQRAWDIRDRATPGFDGTLGTATVLDLLGDPRGQELARHVAQRRHVFSSDSWQTGKVGALIAYLGFMARSGQDEYLSIVEYLADQLTGPVPVTPEYLLAQAGLLWLDPDNRRQQELLDAFTVLLDDRETQPANTRCNGLTFLAMAADQLAAVAPDMGAALRQRLNGLARGYRRNARSILHGMGAAAITLADAVEPDDLAARAAIVDQLHARVVQTPEGHAVPAEGLLRLSCDLTAGSASLLVVHASITTSVNQLAEVLAPRVAAAVPATP